MAGDTSESLAAFVKADIDMDSARQDLCCCCQSSHIWDYSVATDSAPALLECGHSMCFNCVKTQWLDVETQDGTIFCLECSKRVSILHVNSTEKEVCEDQSVSEEQPLSTRSDDGSTGVWTLEQKDRIQPEGWVNAGICDNFVLKLITSNANSCLPGSALILDSTSGLVSNLLEPEDAAHSASSLTPIKEEIVSDKTLLGYIVEDSMSETGINNANVNDKIEVRGQTNTLASPDLNLKALLQMLEKNSLPSLGASVESNETNHGSECIARLENGYKEAIHSLEKSHTVCSNHELDRSGPEKQLCEEIGIEGDWFPIGIPQNESFISRKEKLPLVQSLPCTVYLPNSDTVASEDCISMNGMTPQCRTLKQLDRISGNPVSHVWYSQADRDFQNKSNPRSRRGRKRKPLLRHYQSELFMRPYLKHEHSPQLQLVKLVRRRAQDRKDEEKIAASVSREEKFLHKPELIKKHAEDPELAFMKTVDMPSGKRVEDIYVVPSVWISNEKKNAGKPSCVKEPLDFPESDLCSYLPGETNQRVPVQVPSHGSHPRLSNTCQHPCWRQGQSSFSGCQSIHCHPAANSSRRSLHSTSFSNAHTIRPTQNLYKVIRGHIITTLNAPKIEPVPSLKDLCKAVLGLDAEMAISQMRENKYAYLSQNHMATQHSLNDPSGVSKEMSLEIKTPKEFLDMRSASQHVPELPEMSSETKHTDKKNAKDTNNKVKKHPESASSMNSPSCDVKNPGKFDIRDGTEPLMDNQETLPENPLFTEDAKKSDGIKSISLGSDFCKHLQATKVAQQFHNQSVIYSSAEETESSQIQESFRYMYPTVGLINGTKSRGSDYIIPITSCKLTDVAKCEQPTSDCRLSLDDGGPKKIGLGSFSCPPYSLNSYPVMCDDSFSDDALESSLVNLPSLVSITKQIRNLSSLEPLNKPLASLTTALQLLSSAEKTLCDCNFVVYRQVKYDTKSKLGHLNLCIRKLGDVIITLGGTLQEWMKETSNRCFKTMGILTELYNSNVVALTELITPYFHYICELIASCHSEVGPWNKQEPSDHGTAKRLGNHLSVTPAGWLDANIANTVSYRTDSLESHAFGDSQQSLSPKGFKRQDYDPLLPSKEDSETSLSGQGSAKSSPRAKGISAKRGRPQGFKNSQRRIQVNHLKNKPKQVLSPLGPRRNQSTYSDLKCRGPSGKLLPNKILINMTMDSIWDEGSATDIHRSQTIASHMVADHVSDDSMYGKDDQQMVEVTSSTTAWVLPSDTKDTYLEVSSIEESKDFSTESSPSKKLKYEQDDASTLSNIVVALPEGINIVVSSAFSQTTPTPSTGSANTMTLHDSTGRSLNICAADFQNIFFIHNSENPGSFLQLDPQLSVALLNNLRENKDVQEQFQMELTPGDQRAAVSDSIKDEVGESEADSCLDPNVNIVGGNGFICGPSSSEDADSL
ncbi:unnamed protein product [Candidula unifasciata]|uniref:RING-type domain-containing protein n=1 Tax=Candidula unifasciata TaxID=100452 RepID=A0A8S3YWP0_9EUPU|nr:unnamed protein product [Candidula unifasciata]